MLIFAIEKNPLLLHTSVTISPLTNKMGYKSTSRTMEDVMSTISNSIPTDNLN